MKNAGHAKNEQGNDCPGNNNISNKTEVVFFTTYNTLSVLVKHKAKTSTVLIPPVNANPRGLDWLNSMEAQSRPEQ